MSRQITKKSFILISGQALAEIRVKKGYDQTELARITGISRQTINTWEKKEMIKMEEAKAQKVGRALGIDLRDLTIDKTNSGEVSRQATKTMDMDVWELIKLNSEILGLEFKNLWDMIHSMRPESGGKIHNKTTNGES